MTAIEKLSQAIGYHFKDPALLAAALTHPASLNRKDRGPKNKSAGVPYERMEFLGDRVLNLTIAAWLYEKYPQATEGELARQHAALVQRETLAAVGQKLGLLEALTLAPGDYDNTRGHATLLGDAVEAIFGAIYLDSDFTTAERIIRNLLADAVEAQGTAPRDPKTALQEWAQGRGQKNKPTLPVYRVIDQSGPSHAPLFTVEVLIAKHAPVQATGASKQEAEKAAATLLLQQIKSKT